MQTISATQIKSVRASLNWTRDEPITPKLNGNASQTHNENDVCGRPLNTEAFVLYERMVNAIKDVLKTDCECTPSDLIIIGFSQEEIKSHWRTAYVLALLEFSWGKV